MNTHSRYAIIGLTALRRAVAHIAEEARRSNFKVPIWRNGRIEYGIPEVEPEQAPGGDGEERGGTS